LGYLPFYLSVSTSRTMHCLCQAPAQRFLLFVLSTARNINTLSICYQYLAWRVNSLSHCSVVRPRHHDRQLMYYLRSAAQTEFYLPHVVQRLLLTVLLLIFTREFLFVFYLYFNLVQMRSVILCNRRICMYVCNAHTYATEGCQLVFSGWTPAVLG